MADRDEDIESRDDDDSGEPGAEVPPPRANPDLVGHEAAETTLLQAFAANRLPHGLLITGPHGIGKATLAFRFARFLLAQASEGSGLFERSSAPPTSLSLAAEHPVFRRVASGGHADLMTVERGFDPKRKKLRTEIVVEDTRTLGGFLHLTPAEGGWRIVIVDTADDMNRNAANALLKILEEPPQRAILILVSDNPGRLLATIRSRCRILALRPLLDETVGALIARYRPDLAVRDRAALVDLAEGSIGRALELAAEGGVKLHRQLLELMAALPNLDGAALHRFVDQVVRWGNDDPYYVLADIMPATLARAITQAAQAGGGAEVGLAAVIGRGSLDRWVEVWEKINRLFAQADAVNLDHKQVVLNAFFALEEAAR